MTLDDNMKGWLCGGVVPLCYRVQCWLLQPALQGAVLAVAAGHLRMAVWDEVPSLLLYIHVCVCVCVCVFV